MIWGDRPSPWEARYGEPFEQTLIPFGALVYSRPGELNPSPKPKTASNSRPAIFLGYEQRPGGRLTGNVFTVELDLFRENFSFHHGTHLKKVILGDEDGESDDICGLFFFKSFYALFDTCHAFRRLTW